MEYLLPIFIESGMTSMSMNGEEPLTWTELSSYLGLFGYELSNYDISILRKMSITYVQGLNKYKQRGSTPPLQDPNRSDADVLVDSNHMREISNQLKEMLKSFNNKNQE